MHSYNVDKDAMATADDLAGGADGQAGLQLYTNGGHWPAGPRHAVPAHLRAGDGRRRPPSAAGAPNSAAGHQRDCVTRQDWNIVAKTGNLQYVGLNRNLSLFLNFKMLLWWYIVIARLTWKHTGEIKFTWDLWYIFWSHSETWSIFCGWILDSIVSLFPCNGLLL